MQGDLVRPRHVQSMSRRSIETVLYAAELVGLERDDVVEVSEAKLSAALSAGRGVRQSVFAQPDEPGS